MAEAMITTEQNMMVRMATVRVAELGSIPQELNVPDGSTVAQVLELAGVNQGLQVRLNSNPVDPTQEVTDGDVLVALPAVKGGYLQ